MRLLIRMMILCGKLTTEKLKVSPLIIKVCTKLTIQNSDVKIQVGTGVMNLRCYAKVSINEARILFKHQSLMKQYMLKKS